jgi:predicted nucleic acid-binding Zn ribbon protein
LKNCLICGKEFEDTITHTKKCCSKSCSNKLCHERDRERNLIRLRCNNLIAKGVELSDTDKENINKKLQSPLCEICGEEISFRKLCLDHNHTTKKFRGVLCIRCNNLVGFLENNENILDKAFNYIRN